MDERLAQVETAARVAATIKEEVTSIERVVTLIEEALATYGETEPGTVIVHGVGGLLQDFYTGIESVFNHVAPHMNGTVSSGDTWHRDLLHSMTLDLDGVRPPVISGRTEADLVAYLRFRHLYRHMYGFKLDWARVRKLATGIAPMWPVVRGEIESFVGHLDAMVARTTGGRRQ